MKQTLKACFWFALCVSSLSGVVFLSWCNQATAQTSDTKPENSTIVIWVYNYARIPKNTMARAEKNVQHLLGVAALHFDWVDCPTSAEEVKVHPVCQELMSNAELGLTILPTARGVADAYIDRDFGIAQVFNNGQFGHYAYVFYDRVERTAELAGIPASELLG